MAAQQQSDKHCKGFSSWQQLVAMLYAQLSGASSLRQTVAGFNSAVAHHYHLGCEPICRSTLSQANGARSSQVFALALRFLMDQAGRVHREMRRDCEQLMLLLDSTSITLKGRHFDDWTQDGRNRNTQGIKLHLLMDGDSLVPVHASMSRPNVNDIEEGRRLPIEPGALYIFDKGYCDYTWWHAIAQGGAQFVTRFKYNASLSVEQTLAPQTSGEGSVISDEIVRLKNRNPGGKRRNPYVEPLRRITVMQADKPRPLVLATNDMSSPAEEIAQRYKERWQIELFFKWIKQHLNIKRFLGRNENAVRIQILTALIAYVMLALYKRAQGSTKDLWSFLGEFRASMFTRPHLEVLRERRRRQNVAEFTRSQPDLFT